MISLSYCQITCSAKEPVAIEHMGEDEELCLHPAYRDFKLESYIGMPICLNGELRRKGVIVSSLVVQPPFVYPNI